MGTRAVYTFKDQFDTFHIYKHWDGYPTGAADFINEATAFAWELPRFEAADFAAAFVVANKCNGGDVYISAGPDAHGDLSYVYEISSLGGALHVVARPCRWDAQLTATKPADPIYDGPLSDFAAWAEENEKSVA